VPRTATTTATIVRKIFAVTACANIKRYGLCKW
jgi:hypothetical protein